MTKIKTIVTSFSLVFFLHGCSQILEPVSLFDVNKDNLSREDQQRFAGKEIHFLINFDENSIMDISEDTEVSIITGMYGPEDKKSFTINDCNNIKIKNCYQVSKIYNYLVLNKCYLNNIYTNMQLDK